MFRFTIRELVLLTLVVAVGVGWWVEHGQLTAVRRQLIRVQADSSLIGDALSQTTYAIHELGIHWRWLNGKVILRPTTPSDGPPIKGVLGEPALQPNFDISQFAGARMPGSTSQPVSPPP